MKTVPLKAAGAATLKHKLCVNIGQQCWNTDEEVLFLRMTNFIPLLTAQTHFFSTLCQLTNHWAWDEAVHAALIVVVIVVALLQQLHPAEQMRKCEEGLLPMVVRHILAMHAGYCSERTLMKTWKSYKIVNSVKLMRLRDTMLHYRIVQSITDTIISSSFRLYVVEARPKKGVAERNLAKKSQYNDFFL